MKKACSFFDCAGVGIAGILGGIVYHVCLVAGGDVECDDVVLSNVDFHLGVAQ